MIAKGGLKIFILMTLSAAATGALSYFEQNRAELSETAAALRLSRQIVAQAEGMELAAREKGEKDPLTWAVDTLTQGTEPRIMLLRRLSGHSGSQTPETYLLDRQTGHFEYSRILNPESGSGVRVLLDLKAAGMMQGFLGSQTQLAEDAAFAFVFLGIFFFLSTLASWLWGEPAEPLPQLNEISHIPLFKPEFSHSEAKASLGALGIEIRNLLKQAHAMAVAMRNSGMANEGLREKIRNNLNRLHSNRKLLKEVTRLIDQTETLIEASQPGGEQKQLHALLEKLKDLSVENERVFRELEIQMEPCFVDADLASEAYQKALTAADQMSGNIQRTKEQLAKHIRLIQNPATSDEAPKPVAIGF